MFYRDERGWTIRLRNQSQDGVEACDLNMPNPIPQHIFEDHLAAIKSATEAAAEQTMNLAASELRIHLNVQGDNVADCRAMFDITWRKQRHSSLYGAVTCIGALTGNLTGKLLNYGTWIKCAVNVRDTLIMMSINYCGLL